ncbi:MAG: hypothetical protein EOO22_07720, partial [Comamonadaceae bacterium]
MKLSTICLSLALWTCAGSAGAQAASAQAALLALHVRKSAELAHSPLGRPVLLESRELPGGIQGDVFAVIDRPVEALRAAFDTPAQWCAVLLLHVNNRRCLTGRAQDPQQVTLGIVRRYDKPAAEAFDLPFMFRVAPPSPDHLEVKLHAASGPFGTSNYRILLEAVRLD